MSTAISRREFFTLVLSLFSLAGLIFPAMVTAQSTSCKSLPSVSITETIDKNEKYNFWLLVKKLGDNPKVFLQVDNGDCIEMEQPNSTDWQWLHRKSGGALAIESGSHTFKISSDNGSLLVDKLLTTNDKNCTPQSDGKNCVEEDLKISVDGVESGATVVGNKIVIGNVVSSPLPTGTIVEFYIDNMLITKQDKAPYCLVLDGMGCANYNFSQMTNGTHEIKMLASASTRKTQTVVSFIVDKNLTTPISSEELTEQPPKQNVAQSTLYGSTTAPKNSIVVGSPIQKVSGIVPLAVPNSATQRVSKVEYSIDGKIVATATEDEPFAKLDTTTISNGDKEIMATLFSTNGDKNSLTSKITVDNKGVTSIGVWVGSHKVLFSALLIITTTAMLVAIFFIKRRKDWDILAKEHNFGDNYQYVVPSEQVTMQNLGSYAAVLILFFGAGSLIFINSNRANASTGFGFVAEVDAGDLRNDVNAFELSFSSDMNERYVKMSYKSTVTAGTNPSAPTPSSSTPVSSPNPSPTPATPPTSPNSAPSPAPAPTTPPSNSPSSTPSTNPMPGMQGIKPYINNALFPERATGTSDKLVLPATHSIKPISDDRTGVIRTVCGFSHMGYDDPIVFPGQPGMSHLHTFFGNATINANTKETVGGASTCHGGSANSTGYWIPSMIDGTGRPIPPSFIEVYYKTGYQGSESNVVGAPPKGLRMIAGDSTLRSPSPEVPTHGRRIINYTCDNGNFASIPNCPVGSRLSKIIEFPQCWDGKNLDSPDHKSHMSYGINGKGCPASHPVAIPVITEIVRYDKVESATGNWRLSSDNYDGPAGYSGHADWWNGWDQDIFNAVVQSCYKTARDCSTDLVGDGRQLSCRLSDMAPISRKSLICDLP